MKQRNLFIITAVAACLMSFCAADLRAQNNDIDINQRANFLVTTPPTPIAITGFSGEVAAALKFDLTVMGFIDVAPEAAKYVLTGANNGNVQGQLSFGKTALFSK